jgi:predicted O-methyltransferase YrrM
MKKSENIPGWFDYQKTYDFLLSSISNNGIFVECGAWLGKSSTYLYDKSNGRINIYIVDHFNGSLDENAPTYKLAKQYNIYKKFINNIGDRKVNIIKKLSKDAVNEFTDNSCDVVFIDLTHTYEYVKEDINLWLPKVKNGGYLAGHDYTKSWPGVISAVNEILNKSNIIVLDNCWIFKK